MRKAACWTCGTRRPSRIDEIKVVVVGGGEGCKGLRPPGICEGWRSLAKGLPETEKPCLLICGGLWPLGERGKENQGRVFSILLSAFLWGRALGPLAAWDTYEVYYSGRCLFIWPECNLFSGQEASRPGAVEA